jgi:hypothetical protein
MRTHMHGKRRPKPKNPHTEEVDHDAFHLFGISILIGLIFRLHAASCGFMLLPVASCGFILLETLNPKAKVGSSTNVLLPP